VDAFLADAVCGSTLAELHEHDLLAMGVTKLGHRKVIMQSIRVLFDDAAPAAANGAPRPPAVPASGSGRAAAARYIEHTDEQIKEEDTAEDAKKGSA
jgi:hypothetical protein